MADFLKKIKSTIESRRLLRPHGRIVVAVSGGADSVALLAALTDLGYDCVAAHCNFHLRGEESNRDMRHVEALTARMGTDLYVKEFDVRARMKLTGESVEMACRELRYQWFFDLLDRDRAQAIAVGHHREDQIETFFLNLLRGSGLAGLSGMRHRNEHVVRPLLDVSRHEIEEYLLAKGLAWIEDSSNEADDYARNRLRHHILPALRENFADAFDGILRSMSILRETDDFYRSAINRFTADYTSADSGEIDLAALSAREPMAPLILFEYLKAEGFNRSQTDDMLRAAERYGGEFRVSDSHVRDLDHGILRAPRARLGLKGSGTDVHSVTLLRNIHTPVRIDITSHSVAEFRPERNPNVIYLDESALKGSPAWMLRRWRRGDRISPYGMQGSKLVSDIFSAARMSGREKAEAWLLTRNGEVVWVVGRRASSLFTVGPETRRYLRLEYVAPH